MKEFKVKDSGNRQEFSTGAVRDTSLGKSRPDLIHPYVKERLGQHMRKGADKYNDWNWTKGIPMSRFLESLERHLMQFQLGETDEDHLGAIMFNAMGLMTMPWLVERGLAPKELLDLPDWRSRVPTAEELEQNDEGTVTLSDALSQKEEEINDQGCGIESCRTCYPNNKPEFTYPT